MNLRHENILDDQLTQLYFSTIDASHQLIPVHWHYHMEIVIPIEGKMIGYINNNCYQLQPYDILVVNPQSIHYTDTPGNSRYHLLQIPAAHLDRMSPNRKLLHFSEYIPYNSQPDSLNAQLCECFNRLNQINETQDEGSSLLFLSELYRILYLLYTQNSTVMSVQSLNRTQQDFNRMEQVMQYVASNYDKPILLNDMADLLSVSPEYFCRLFKKNTGQTFFTYLNQVRLLHFHHDLLTTNDSITYLMEKNGITNYNAFLRSFKEAYGTTPHRLRKNQS